MGVSGHVSLALQLNKGQLLLQPFQNIYCIAVLASFYLIFSRLLQVIYHDMYVGHISQSRSLLSVCKNT